MAQFRCNFYSYTLGFGVDIDILIPSITPCDAVKTHKLPAKFPVLYLLHGHGNDYLSWSRCTSLERYCEERRIAVVTMSVGNKGYMNAEYGENWYDFVGKELPEFVTANFPVSSRREDTYIAGASMGGYGALAHALGHPEDYRAVGVFSPATDWGEQPSRISHAMPQMLSLYDLLEKAEGKALPDIFCCIGDGDFLLESMDAFHSHLETKNIPHRYDRVEGWEHEWGFWDKMLPEFLDWLPRTDFYAAMPRRKM